VPDDVIAAQHAALPTTEQLLAEGVSRVLVVPAAPAA
jgi:hypothetical protein